MLARARTGRNSRLENLMEENQIKAMRIQGLHSRPDGCTLLLDNLHTLFLQGKEDVAGDLLSFLALQ